MEKQKGNLSKNTHVRTMSDMPPIPYVPHFEGELTLLNIAPVELARQLTLSESAIFSRIQPSECLDQNWSKNGGTKAPRIVALIDRFNLCSRWVTSEIVTEMDVNKRALLITHFIRSANECRLLQNFNSMMGLVSGLLGSSVSRLQRSWDKVPADLKNIFDMQFSHMFDRNFKIMRDAVKQSNPPCLPYIGIYLADLTFIEDGNVNTVANGKLINFEKRLMMARVIGELRVYQQKSYRLEPVSVIQDFVENTLSGKRITMLSDKEAHTQSLLREPRQ